MTVEKFADIPADDVRNRLRSADQLLAWLAGELVDRAGNVDQVRPDKSGKAPNRVGRLSMQMSRAVELVRLAVEQVDLHRDLGQAWVLLEQSRQQVGWAAEGLWLIGGSPAADAEQAEQAGESAQAAQKWEALESEALEQITWLMQRELMPRPADAKLRVVFGDEPNLRPDFEPETALELMPLQLLANASMTFSAGEAVDELDRREMGSAFAEYVARILGEATALVEFGAARASGAGVGGVEHLTETGMEVAALIGGAFPRAEEVFVQLLHLAEDRD